MRDWWRERLLRRRERIEERRRRRRERVELIRKEVRMMKERWILKAIIAILRAILPSLEERAKKTPSPVDDIIVRIIRAITEMRVEEEEEKAE